VVVEAAIDAGGVSVNYKVHLCLAARTTRVERRVRAVELMIDHTLLPSGFLDWLEDHEEELADRIAWDAFERCCRETLVDFTPFTVSTRFIGRN
jgi:hypothetical protein